jgi:hypothetical protein
MSVKPGEAHSALGAGSEQSMVRASMRPMAGDLSDIRQPLVSACVEKDSHSVDDEVPCLFNGKGRVDDDVGGSF